MTKKVQSQERAYRWIRRKLVEGRVRSPRDLSLRRIAAEVGVSHVCVDDAFHRLEGEGLLVSRPRSGTFVRELSSEEFQNLCDVRECIEPYGAARAARLITAEQLTRLKNTWSEMQSLHDELEKAEASSLPAEYAERLVRLELAFHGTIMEAARNPEAARVVENARILSHLMINVVRESRSRLLAGSRETLAAHQNILEAICRGDAAFARSRMLRHVRTDFPEQRQLLQDDPSSESND